MEHKGLLEVRNLKKYFDTNRGPLQAVDNISFSIEKGRTLGVVGESGCGKSTLGRTILRLQEPTSGEIWFNGEDIVKYDKKQVKALRSKMQIIFQDPYSSLDPRKTAAKIAVLGEQIRQHRPLVHCITNPIAIHDSANIVLAAGGRPIMAEHPQEVEEIVRTAQVLVLNLGNITDVRMSSMKKAFQEALKNRVPTVLDLVGIQCSSLRLHYAKELLEIGSPTVLKGNMSEMRKLAGLSTYGTGVDAGERDRFSEENEKEILPAFYRLSEEYRSVLLVTGQEDLIIEGPHCYCLTNGDAMLGTITGTGCMLGALCGTYLTEAAESRGQAVLAAAAVMGIAGELGAENSRGPGSFQIAFLDALYDLQEEEIRNRLRLREKIKQNFE